MGMTIFTDRVLAGILREKVGASEFACAAANLAADRIEQLVATNEQLVMERDTIREAALREAYNVVYKWWFGDGNELPQELILKLIGEKND